MGDQLDNFFAKKDKKKGKKNYVVPEELVQQIKENGQGGDRKKRDKDRDSAVASVIPKLLDQVRFQLTVRSLISSGHSRRFCFLD